MKTKEQRKQEADERNYAWSLLSNAEKLVELDKRYGQSAKQRAKIAKAEGENGI